MLKSYSRDPAFSDAESQKITAALMDEVNICSVYFPRLKDEGVIFRMLVFWARLTSARLSFLMTKNNPVRAPVVASLTSSLRDLEKFNYLDMFALVSFQETNCA